MNFFNKNSIVIVSAVTTACFIIGIIFFLIQRNWLIIQLTCRVPTIFITDQTRQSKSIKVFYWKHHGWQKENITIIWDDNKTSRNLTQLVTQWLTILQQEGLINRFITLQSIAVSTAGTEAFISFDRVLFGPDWSIMKKWLIIEGLFRNMHQASLPIQNVTFLINKSLMHDDHLDFSQPIPVQKWITDCE